LQGHIILNINVDGLIGTYLHFLEFLFKVPYRYKKDFNGQIITNNQIKKINFEYYVRDLNIDTTWNRKKIIELLQKEGGRQEFKFGDLKISWSHSKNMDDILSPCLNENKNFFLT
jgi:aminoglycoside 3-N-acetyltransferase